MVPFRTTRSIALSSLNVRSILDVNTVTGVFSSKSIYTNFGSGSATGAYSLAEGFNTLAKGSFSHAEGRETVASGDYSHVEGYEGISFGVGSHSEGMNNIAGGYSSHAEGGVNTAAGSYSHVEGALCVAGKKINFFTYDNTTKVFTFSQSLSNEFNGVVAGDVLRGYEFDILGDVFKFFVKSRSTVTGEITAVADPIGGSSSNGYLICPNYGFIAHAEGNETEASGSSSHAEGAQTISRGYTSHAEGFLSIAEGDSSHAEGSTTKAIGNYSHAQGNSTVAYGESSNSEGELTKAHGDLSHAAGYAAEARHERTWIWKGSTDTNILSTTKADQFLVSAAGGVYLANNVGIGTDNNQNALTVVGLISTDKNLTSNEWRSVWTTVSANSASWEESGDILPTVTNYLSTNMVRISALTVTEYISANTIVSNGTMGIISDITNEPGFGNNTLTLNFSGGVFVRNNLTSLSALSTVLYGDSIQWWDARNTLRANSASYVTIVSADAKYLPVSGGRISGNLIINGGLSALGSTVYVNTVVTVTSALSVVNEGTGPALFIKQTGSQPVALFLDDTSTALVIEDGGNVGIGVDDPTAKLHVNGTIKANNQYSSDEWASVYSTVYSNSAGWEQTDTLTKIITATTADYLSSNNVLMLSASIMGSLSVVGTIYSSNTAYAIQYFNEVIGNNISSAFNITHNFNSKNIVVTVRDVTTNEVVYPNITFNDDNSINVAFTFVPPSNAYSVTIIGANNSNKIAAYGTTNTIVAIERYQFFNTNFNIVTSGYYGADTRTNIVRATLPASPNIGDTMLFIDPYKSWTTNYFVLQNNGNNIESVNESLTADVLVDFKVTFVGSTVGWRIY